MSTGELAEREEAAVRDMLFSEFNIVARPFQVKIIREMRFHSRSILMVHKTGDGKSMVPLGSVRMKRGVGIIVVPLLTIGSGQEAAAGAACKNMEAIHWDGLSKHDKQLLLERLNATHDRSRCIVLFVSPQSLDGKSNNLRSAIEGLFRRGVVSTVGIDELHRVPLDALFFRRAFGRLKKNLFAFRALSPTPVALVAMTATLTAELLDQFKVITGLEFDVVEWGDTQRRNIALKLSFADSPAKELKKLVVAHRENAGKIVLYTNHSTRAETNLRDAVEKVLPAGEDAATIVGKTPAILKTYFIDGWGAPIKKDEEGTGEEGGDEAHHPSTSPLCLNLTVLIATGAANCGIDSRECTGVGREGPPPHIIDMLQEMGRIRFQDDGMYEYLVALNVAIWASLILRIQKTESAAERARQRSSLLVVLKLLVLTPRCVHTELETAFSMPGGEPVASLPDECKDKCWFCNPALTHGGGSEGKVKANKVAAGEALTRCFSVNGSTPSADVLGALYSARAKIWPEVKKATKQYASRLLLQLIASEILSFTARLPHKKEKGVGSVLMNWNFIHWKSDERWQVFST